MCQKVGKGLQQDIPARVQLAPLNQDTLRTYDISKDS